MRQAVVRLGAWVPEGELAHAVAVATVKRMAEMPIWQMQTLRVRQQLGYPKKKLSCSKHWPCP